MSSLDEFPKGVEALNNRLKLFFPHATIQAARDYVPKSTDIFVAGPQKSGTTWLQQIVYGLKSGGDMEYEDIGEVVPVIENFQKFGIRDFYALQKFQPNTFKSHLRYDMIPKGDAKHIIIIRNPSDAAISRYYYFEDWLFKKGEISMEEFIEWFYIKPCPPYDIQMNSIEMNFIAKAYPHRNDKGVLWLHYEDLKENLKECIRLISDFLGIGISDQKLLDLIEHQASFDFMKKHKEKFSTMYIRKMMDASLGITKDDYIPDTSSRVRKGVTGEGKETICPDQLKAMDARWNEIAKPICGYETYAEMRAGINKELGRSFEDV
eukprot:g8457.t1